MNKVLLASAVVLVAIFLASVSLTLWPSAEADDGGGGVGTPSNNTPPAGPPVIVDPPAATLTTPDGREVVAGVGTRCWGGVCLDIMGPVSNPDPFQTHAGDRLTLTFGAGSPSSTASAWVRVEDEPSELTDNGARLWTGSYPDLTRDLSGSPPAELDPGEYLFVVRAFFASQGDVTYAFYLKVQ